MSVSANQIIKRAAGCRVSAPVADGAVLYEGTLAFVSATGYAEEGIAGGVNRLLGVVIADQDNTNGLDGDLHVECWRDGVFELVGSGFSQATVGMNIYASDNYSVNAIGTGVRIGRCVGYVSSTKILVELDAGPEDLVVSIPILPHASLTEQNLFVAREAYRVVSIDYVPDLVQGSALTGTVCKASGTAAPANGTTPMHEAAAINFNATAHTVQSITLTATVADLQLAAGDRIGLDLSAALSTGRGVLTIRLRRI